MTSTVDIQLKRTDRKYRAGDKVEGVVVVNSKGSMSHSGITLKMEGSVQLQLSAKSVGLFEAFYNSVKPVQLLNLSVTLAKANTKLPDGRTELPFEFELTPLPGQTLYETYHGVFVNVTYNLTCDIKRGVLSKDMSSTAEIFVEQFTEASDGDEEVPFDITPAKLENIKKSALKNIPNFLVTGSLNKSNFEITEPFEGRLVVEKCDAQISSIELQLVRVETCGCADGYSKEATEIQNIQCADGDVVRGQEIPLFMIFPRLFTCGTTATRTFKIEFEVNLVIVFSDSRLITWNFPITLHRRPKANSVYR